MAKFTVDVYEGDLVWLAFAAGIATGQGNEAAAQSLYGILNRLTPVDDEYRKPNAVYDLETDSFEGDNGAPEQSDPDSPGLRLVDPNFVPPEPVPPSSNQADFGAGPTPSNLT